MTDNLTYDDSAFIPSPINSAIQSILLTPLQDDSIARIKSQAKRLAHEPVSVQTAASGTAARSRLFRTKIFSTVAAAVVLIVLGTLATVIFNSSTSAAFADVLAKVKEVRTVQ